MNNDTIKLYQFCQFNCELISSYIFVENFGRKSSNENSQVSPVKSESMSELLHIDQTDLDAYNDLKNKQNGMLLRNPKHKKVNFQIENDKKEINLAKYLSCFELPSSSNTIRLSIGNDTVDLNEKSKLNLCKNLTSENKQLLGKFIFSQLLEKSYEFNESNANQFIGSIPLEKIILLVSLI